MSNNTTTRQKKQLIIGIDPDTQGSGWTGDKVTRFRVAKHRDAEPTALEITEELLTKNVQL